MITANGYCDPQALFAAPPKRRYRDVEIDGLGRFRLQSLTDLEKSRYDAAAVSSRGKLNRWATESANARLIALCCVDADGNRIFGDGDVEKLQQLDAGHISELAQACNEHCGFSEDTAKNYETTADDDSPAS